MTPLEKAAGVLERGTLINGKHCKPLAEMVITAFLEAAAEDADVRLKVECAMSGRHWSESARLGILALKEAVNG